MKKTLLPGLLLLTSMLLQAQTLYVNTGASYRQFSLGQVGDIRWTNDQLTLADTTLTVTSIDSLTFQGRNPQYEFLPAESIESVSSTGRITTRVPALQDAQANTQQGPMRIARWTQQPDGSYLFQQHPIVTTVQVDISALKSLGTIDRLVLTSTAGEDISQPLTYNPLQEIDWLSKPQATGTLTVKSGSSKYAANLKSDVVVVQNIPADASQVTAYILPVRLTQGLTLTAILASGEMVTCSDSQTQQETATSTGSTAVTLQTSITPDRATRRNNWMAAIPGNTKYNLLSIPGTHDAATSSVSSVYNDMARTQTLSIEQQLQAGVRAFDLRPRFNASRESDIQLDNLEIYHGIVGTGVKWKDAMDLLVRFVQDNPTEAVLVKMQKEDASGSNDYSATWRTSIRTWLQDNKSHLVQKITPTMTLSDVRGKVLVISNNPYGAEGSNYATVYGGLVNWQDNCTFDSQINYTNNAKIVDLTAEDSYNASNDDKIARARANLAKASSDTSTRWYMTFLNVAWKLFGASISSHAKAVNAPISQSITAQDYAGRLGIIMMDYAGDAGHSGTTLLQGIIQQNYRYVYEGR